MFTRKFADLTRYAVLPLLLVGLLVMTLTLGGTQIARLFPYYRVFAIFIALITIERLYTYERAVSQRHMIWRDLMSTAVQTFIAGATLSAVILPVLQYFPNTFLGRRFLFALSDQLGPLWVQVLAVFLLSSLFQYWMHRFQHVSDFLWKLHGYHHSVTHLQASNIFLSNPLDWVLRNALGGILLGIVGFNPVAVVISTGLSVYADFSHCGGDMRSGWLSYFFNTPEVHRWHHSVEFPDEKKFRYGCNFGVGFSFWDILFGTFHLPRDEKGKVMAPPSIGHPEGYPDEPNYLKILLAARAFPSVERLFRRKTDLSSVPAE